ncbi:hypothetical protein M0R72_12680 [Candidatus Pacearchaeota archaeon]|jgi:riboflavin biosynthesis pyrimidine reductase|nr:hypothetical protein [Candidatus Pacearchaeota archaeon]
MKVGDAVEWTSQSGGYQTTKRGVVVAIVHPGVDPNNIVSNKFAPLVNPGMSRRHESYLVVVDGKTYWPRVSNLRRNKVKNEIVVLRHKLSLARRLLSVCVFDAPEDVADLAVVMEDAKTKRIMVE